MKTKVFIRGMEFSMANTTNIAYEQVKLARANTRITGISYINGIFTDFLELHGDRAFADDPAIVSGIGMLNDMPVTVIAIEKGRTAKERVERNFGAPNPEGYRKALRLMKQAEKFNRPVLCLVDTSGAYCGIGAEERGQGQSIAANLMEMSALKTPVISILTGEGGSGGALALAVADRVWMLENAIYSVISPEGCASILYKDANRAPEAAQRLKLTAKDAMLFGIIDEIIKENGIGAQSFFHQLRNKIYKAFQELSAISIPELTDLRYKRFREIGKEHIM